MPRVGQNGRHGGRRGGTNPVVVVLLAGILAAMVALIAVLVTQRGGTPPALAGSPPVAPAGAPVAEGRTVLRSELPSPPAPPKPVDDPVRIRETLKAGRTYRVTLKAALDCRVEDKAWGIKELVSLAYAAEMEVDRIIESNDGRKVVELRHFVASRSIKLLCDVEGVAIEMGKPGQLVLRVLDTIRPGTKGAVELAEPIVEALIARGSRSAARAKATKAVAHVDTLSAKRVRITYVDGLGVEAIEPVGCTLSDEERDFVFGTAILSDCYILPDTKAKPGESWPVDGHQLAGLIDPSLRGRPSGRVVVAREADTGEGADRHASLSIVGGTIAIDSSDAKTRRIGSFKPEGQLRYSLAGGFVDRAELSGRFDVEEVSTDHLLFETSFKSRPTLRVDYACTIR